MSYYLIEGGKPLGGEIACHGSKNAVLPQLCAALMMKGRSRIEGCPDITDVDVLLDLISSLGAGVKKCGKAIDIDPAGLSTFVVDEKAGRMRASICLVGPLLARFGKVKIPYPGGCAIGRRPVDMHLWGLGKMGAKAVVRDNYIEAFCTALDGCHIELPFPSVGVTENLMMAAALARGRTCITNCAREPEIAELSAFLNKCGARITGTGTDRITIEGVKRLEGAEHCVMGDRIEAGTFLCLAAGTGGNIRVNNIDSGYLGSFLDVLEAGGCRIKKDADSIILQAPGRLKGNHCVETAPYPGFPTDLHPVTAAAFLRGDGELSVTENIFEKRTEYAKELRKINADIEIISQKVIIKGKDKISGNNLRATDLRGGAALAVAALTAEGESEVHDIEYIKRGYTDFAHSINILGGALKEIKDEQ